MTIAVIEPARVRVAAISVVTADESGERHRLASGLAEIVPRLAVPVDV
jgi:hypothetical protein